MIQVYVTKNVDGDVEVAYEGNRYYFLIGSEANYLPASKILVLENQDGNTYNFQEAKHEFYINGVLWASTFDALCQELNKNVFITSTVSPPPGTSATIRANAITTGAYVATSAIEVTGRAQVHFDFDITNGGTLANSGCIIAIIEVSDDNSNWKLLNNLTASANLVPDGVTSPYQSGTVFRQFTAEYGPTAIPYVTGSLPSAPIRLSYATGYGRYYRLKVRASDTGGISTGAPATFPDLEIKASLQ